MSSLFDMFRRNMIWYILASMERTIILLTGTSGSGKTTIAETLCTTFSRSAHVPVDYFRKLIKAGYASPHFWNDEVERQYRLARKNAALTARNKGNMRYVACFPFSSVMLLGVY